MVLCYWTAVLPLLCSVLFPVFLLLFVSILPPSLFRLLFLTVVVLLSMVAQGSSYEGDEEGRWGWCCLYFCSSSQNIILYVSPGCRSSSFVPSVSISCPLVFLKLLLLPLNLSLYFSLAASFSLQYPPMKMFSSKENLHLFFFSILSPTPLYLSFIPLKTHHSLLKNSPPSPLIFSFSPTLIFFSFFPPFFHPPLWYLEGPRGEDHLTLSQSKVRWLEAASTQPTQRTLQAIVPFLLFIIVTW